MPSNTYHFSFGRNNGQFIELLKNKIGQTPFIVLIDGSVAAGKTTIARYIRNEFLRLYQQELPIIETDWFLYSKSYRNRLLPLKFSKLENWFRLDHVIQVVSRVLQGLKEEDDLISISAIHRRDFGGTIDNKNKKKIDLQSKAVILEGCFAISLPIISICKRMGVRVFASVINAPFQTRKLRREWRSKLPGYKPLGETHTQDFLLEKVYEPSWQRHFKSIRNFIDCFILNNTNANYQF